MQTVWKGAISFGLVSIPVRLVSATEQRDLTFHQVRASDGSRVRYRRVAEADGAEVPYSAIAKSYTTDDGREVVLTDDDLGAVRVPSSRTVELVGFVAAAEIDPIMLTKSYFAEPAADDRKPYALFRDALVESDRVAVVRIAMRNRERLAVLRPRDDVLVLQTMLWPDEIRTPDFATDAGSTVRSQELAMAESYIDALSGELDLSDQTDHYRQALLELVAAKAEGVEPSPEPEPDQGGAQVVDLVEALRRSVEAAGGRSRPAGSGRSDPASEAGGGGSGPDPGAEHAPDRRTAGRATRPGAAKTTRSRTAAQAADGAGSGTPAAEGTPGTGGKPAKKAAKKAGVKGAEKAPARKTTARKAPARKTSARKAPAQSEAGDGDRRSA